MAVCLFVFIYLPNVISWLLLTSAIRGTCTVHVVPRCCCRALNIFCRVLSERGWKMISQINLSI